MTDVLQSWQERAESLEVECAGLHDLDAQNRAEISSLHADLIIARNELAAVVEERDWLRSLVDRLTAVSEGQ